MNITDKAILVTGANRGIGQALVEEAAKTVGSLSP
jgi:NAD(P)-dependent dehydrogenase (short-subunit alcohol dehydrogenase family)